MVDHYGVSSSSGIDPRDLRRAPEADLWCALDAVLAAVAGLGHHEFALEEFDAARTLEASRAQRRRAGSGSRRGHQSAPRHEYDCSQRKAELPAHLLHLSLAPAYQILPT